MDLALFFKREGAASALVGTLLKEVPEFRKQFFETFAEDLEPNLVQSLKGKDWDVDVEVHQVDIRLVARDGSTILIIENKIRAGAVQANQMVNYYERELRDASGKRIGLVYLAPGPSMGEREVERVREAIQKKGPQRGDFAVRVSWDDVKAIGDKLYPGSEAGDWQSRFIAEGFILIKKVIDASPDEKWPAVGDRKLVKDMAAEVTGRLSDAFPKIQLGKPWPLKHVYTVWTQKTNVTMWLGLVFNPSAEYPYQPDAWRVERGFKLKLTGALKLAGVARRQLELRKQWEEETATGKLRVPVFENLTRQASGWMRSEQEVVGTTQEIVDVATKAGSGLLEVIRRFA
jgi:hypothetical protein